MFLDHIGSYALLLLQILRLLFCLLFTSIWFEPLVLKGNSRVGIQMGLTKHIGTILLMFEHSVLSIVLNSLKCLLVLYYFRTAQADHCRIGIDSGATWVGNNTGIFYLALDVIYYTTVTTSWNTKCKCSFSVFKWNRDFINDFVHNLWVYGN
jgi:hypothetical protein